MPSPLGVYPSVFGVDTGGGVCVGVSVSVLVFDVACCSAGFVSFEMGVANLKILKF